MLPCSTPNSHQVRVFVYDFKTLSPKHAWWPEYVRFAEEPARLGHGPADDFEWPFAMIQLRLPSLLAIRPDIVVVDEPRDADLVLWLVWEFAVCRASGHRMKQWESQKGHVWGSCPAYTSLVAWLQTTERWAANGGRDFVFMAADAHQVVQRPVNNVGLSLAQGGASSCRGSRFALCRAMNASILLSAEDCRVANERGGSRLVPIPYYTKIPKYENTGLPRRTLAAFIGSIRTRDTCPSAAAGAGSLRIRRSLMQKLSSCGSGECAAETLENMRIDRNVVNAGRSGDEIAKTLQSAHFCPSPRGDTATTKRFYSALVAGCAPVVFSNELLPFANNKCVSDAYREALVVVPEAFLFNDFDLVSFLRNTTHRNTSTLGRITSYVYGNRRRVPCVRGRFEECGGGALNFILDELVGIHAETVRSADAPRPPVPPLPRPPLPRWTYVAAVSAAIAADF
jgi:hypothetical protein